MSFGRLERLTILAARQRFCCSVASICGVQTGSGYNIYDNGVNPTKTILDSSKRRDLGFVGFDYDDSGPGKMIVSVPRVTPSGAQTIIRPSTDADTIEQLAGRERSKERLMVLRNKVWSIDVDR